MDENNNNRKSFTEEDERAMQERMNARRQERAAEQKRLAEKKKKRKIIGGKLIFASKIILTVVVILSLLFVAAQSLGNVTFTKATDYIKQSISNLKPGPGYPVEIGADKVIDMQTVGDCVALLESDSVRLLNSTAKEIVRFSHSYSKPVMSTCGGKMLLCDRVTGRYIVADRSNTLKSGELKKELFCCTIGKSGSYAFSACSDNGASILSVFGSDYKKIFDFKCANEYIIGVSFSPNGKFVAAIGIGASKAYSYSKLYIISTESKKEVASFDFAGKTLSSVFYSGKDTVIAVGENSYSVITQNKNKKDIDFGYNTVTRFSPDESGNFGIVLTKYGSVDSGTVALLDSVGTEKFNCEAKADIECIDYDGKTLCVYDSNNFIKCYNSDGEITGQVKLSFDAQRIVVSGKYCYALCFGNLIRLSVNEIVEESTGA